MICIRSMSYRRAVVRRTREQHVTPCPAVRLPCLCEQGRAAQEPLKCVWSVERPLVTADDA